MLNSIHQARQVSRPPIARQACIVAARKGRSRAGSNLGPDAPKSLCCQRKALCSFQPANSEQDQKIYMGVDPFLRIWTPHNGATMFPLGLKATKKW